MIQLFVAIQNYHNYNILHLWPPIYITSLRYNVLKLLSSSIMTHLQMLLPNICRDSRFNKLSDHPRMIQLWHGIKSKNLRFSMKDVRKICYESIIYSALKPQFNHLSCTNLIKSTQTFECLNVGLQYLLVSYVVLV